MNDWGQFVAHFEAHWMDPHESEKAADKLMKGLVQQRGSVKAYNDQFNELLGLTTVDPNHFLILRAYETGLKLAVRNAAVTHLLNNPQMTLRDCQTLLVRLDETLMQTRGQTFLAPQRRYNPTANPSTDQVTHGAQTTAPTTSTLRISTPIKAETAQQYTRLTPEERERLRQLGYCFRCRQPGHIASHCPCNAQVAAIDPLSAPPSLISTDSAVPTDSTTTSDF
jgi:hypothetical protein